SVNRSLSPLMQDFAIERVFQAEIPALLHDRNSAGERSLLLGGQHALGHRHESGDGPPFARDDIFFARFDLANAAGEGLIGFAQADHLGHSSHPRQPHSYRAVAAATLMVFTILSIAPHVARNRATYKP